jgi:hypothetical protein
MPCAVRAWISATVARSPQVRALLQVVRSTGLSAWTRFPLPVPPTFLGFFPEALRCPFRCPSASPRLASPRLASPRLASPRLASPRLASPRLASPRLACSPSVLAVRFISCVRDDHTHAYSSAPHTTSTCPTPSNPGAMRLARMRRYGARRDGSGRTTKQQSYRFKESSSMPSSPPLLIHPSAAELCALL